MKLFIKILVFLFISHTSFGQVKFEPVAYSNFGYAKNIFKAPETLLKADGTAYETDSIILSDMMFDAGYDLSLRYKTKKKHKFWIRQDLWTRNYLDNSSLNEFKVGFDAKYTHHINKDFNVGGDYGISYNDKIGTTVLGSEITLPMKYLKNEASVFFNTDVIDYNKTGLSIGFYNKNYDESIDGRSLNHNHFDIDFGTQYDFYIKKHEYSVSLDINWANRKYKTMEALDASGASQLNETRHWRYFRSRLTFRLAEIGMFSAKVYYQFKRRKDLFADYFTYNASVFGTKLYVKSEKFLVTINPDYTIRNYKVKTAPIPGPNPLLTYKYFDFDAKVQYELIKGLRLQLVYDVRNRETNTEDDSRFTRRPYKTYEIYGGILVNPIVLFKL